MAAPLLSVDINIKQLMVLTVVVTSADPATGRILAVRFGVSMPSMSGVLDRLVALGLATGFADPADHRVRSIGATRLRRTVVQKLVAKHPEFDVDVLARLDIDDLRALERHPRCA